VRRDMKEVLEDRVKGKVGEGKKEGNRNHLRASGIYIIAQSRLVKKK
jgi:hypothetical protein